MFFKAYKSLYNIGFPDVASHLQGTSCGCPRTGFKNRKLREKIQYNNSLERNSTTLATY